MTNAQLKFDAAGLIPVVVQDVASGAVLMVAWANQEAIALTAATGEAHFWSRSRQALWRKGETSGNVLRVEESRLDCDGDTLLWRVAPAGPACHTGARTCFEPAAAAGAPPQGSQLELGWLYDVLAARRHGDPAESYTARLLARGIERVAQKVGEEGTEVVIAGLCQDDAKLTGEAADLLYHLLVLLLARGVSPLAVAAELRRRHAEAASTATAAESAATAAVSVATPAVADPPARRSAGFQDRDPAAPDRDELR
jgi:phosphoribosyl-ATP pyrophosphohydrolase/phosphoribosyl-AMP cyclohydrolase